MTLLIFPGITHLISPYEDGNLMKTLPVTILLFPIMIENVIGIFIEEGLHRLSCIIKK